MIDKNIKIIRGFLDVNQKQFGQELSSSEAMIKSYEQGRAKPSDIFIQRLSNMIGISINDLTTRLINVSELENKKDLSREIKSTIELPEEVVLGDYSKIPKHKVLIPKIKIDVSESSQFYYPNVNVAAGLGFLTENGNEKISINLPNVDAKDFINVFGDSMYPKYCSGEIIGIKEIQKEMVFFGHAYVIEMEDGEAYLKYIKKGKNDEYWTLASENTQYEPKEFHLSKIRRVFIIKAIITKTTLV